MPTFVSRSCHPTAKRVEQNGVEDYVCFSIRDEFSGCGLMCPRTSRSKDMNYSDLKHFTGPAIQRSRPEIVVKSDAAGEIVGAVRDLGWHPEPSLANKWPHNAVHERWISTVKSVTRAAMLQSGFPQIATPWALPYASIVLSIDQRAPIHPHERDAAGNVLPAYHCLLYTSPSPRDGW